MMAFMIKTTPLAIICSNSRSIDNKLADLILSRLQIGGNFKQVPKTGHDCWGEGDGHSRVTSKVSIRENKYSICQKQQAEGGFYLDKNSASNLKYFSSLLKILFTCSKHVLQFLPRHFGFLRRKVCKVSIAQTHPGLSHLNVSFPFIHRLASRASCPRAKRHLHVDFQRGFNPSSDKFYLRGSMAQFDPFLSESTFCVFVVVVLSLTFSFLSFLSFKAH